MPGLQHIAKWPSPSYYSGLGSNSNAQKGLPWFSNLQESLTTTLTHLYSPLLLCLPLWDIPCFTLALLFWVSPLHWRLSVRTSISMYLKRPAQKLFCGMRGWIDRVAREGLPSNAVGALELFFFFFFLDSFLQIMGSWGGRAEGGQQKLYPALEEIA